jgi:hypothetical protein
MRKLILMMILTVVSSSAVAGWIRLDRNVNQTLYVDSASIRKVGNRVKMWNLYDLNNINSDIGKPFNSIKMHDEYDCKEEKSRTLAIYTYAENMGGGAAINAVETPGKWKDVVPDSVIVILWKYACENRKGK